MKQREIPVRTLENLAACQSIGLDFWSEAPPPSTVWALDDQRQPHLVKIDRRRSIAHHKANCDRHSCVLAACESSWAAA
ncbi:DUF7457 domain-containing protein [Mycolicibacterium vinylchloridicum]|uniref:DUF7457 domain-containing protein n=1 Tax=Mycolicibacterium vinylchloridicum TaxID=2736928 RepID=UPI0015C9376D|nr:hypothetical protein [Mycolicibacterium vinylchloridicum]